MHANKREEIQEILAGDICAAVGLKTAHRRHDLRRQRPVVLESIDFPAPVIQLAIEPKTKADQEKLGVAINKLVNEDPTLKVSTDPETGQTILAGMGELHLEIIVDRMKREFNVEANVGKPQVAYRETIRNTAEYEYTHKKQTGGSGQYAQGEAARRAEPGQGFRVQERDSRRLDSEGIHHGSGKGRGGDARRWRARRLSDEQRQGRRRRRRLSRSRLIGNGVQDLLARSAPRKRSAKPSRCCSSR